MTFFSSTFWPKPKLCWSLKLSLIGEDICETKHLTEWGEARSNYWLLVWICLFGQKASYPSTECLLACMNLSILCSALSHDVMDLDWKHCAHECKLWRAWKLKVQEEEPTMWKRWSSPGVGRKLSSLQALKFLLGFLWRAIPTCAQTG